MTLCEYRDFGSWNEYHAANLAQECKRLVQRLGEAPREAAREYHRWDDLLFHDGYLMLVYRAQTGLRWCVGPLCDVLFTKRHETVLHMHVAGVEYHLSLGTDAVNAGSTQEIEAGNVVWSYPMPGSIWELLRTGGDKFRELSDWMDAKTSTLAASRSVLPRLSGFRGFRT